MSGGAPGRKRKSKSEVAIDVAHHAPPILQHSMVNVGNENPLPPLVENGDEEIEIVMDIGEEVEDIGMKIPVSLAPPNL